MMASFLRMRDDLRMKMLLLVHFLDTWSVKGIDGHSTADLLQKVVSIQS
jgi:hypothetical protein